MDSDDVRLNALREARTVALGVLGIGNTDGIEDRVVQMAEKFHAFLTKGSNASSEA